jgi:hypothetical protein
LCRPRDYVERLKQQSEEAGGAIEDLVAKSIDRAAGKDFGALIASLEVKLSARRLR